MREKAFSTIPIKIKELHAVQNDFIDWIDDDDNDNDDDNSDFLDYYYWFYVAKTFKYHRNYRRIKYRE